MVYCVIVQKSEEDWPRAILGPYDTYQAAYEAKRRNTSAGYMLVVSVMDQSYLDKEAV